MKRLIYIFLLFIAGQATAQQQADVLSRQLGNSGLDRTVGEWRYANPALMNGRYINSLTAIQASWLYDSQQQARLLEEGDGSNRADITAEAFIKKGSNDIWGNAGYSIGQRRGVSLNESSDYDLIYPYVTADLVGGNLHEETYRFSGGFAHRLKNGVALGASAGYKALLAYRSVDPRPRNLTSDLDFAAGIRWQWLGLAVKAGKYKQTNVVKFYNEASQPTVYQATGLGTDYFRFRGTNTDTYYNGRNFGLQADASGPFGNMDDAGVHLAYDYFGFDKIISSLNQLPMASAAEHRFYAAAHLLMRPAQCHSIAVEASASRTRRDGTENIFGEAENNIYPEIASLTMLRRTLTECCVKASYEYHRHNVRLQASAIGGYHADRWRYTEPERLMNGDAVIVGADISLSWQHRKCMLTADAGTSALIRTSSQWTQPEDSKSALSASAERQYLLLDNNDCQYHVAMRVDSAIKPGFGIFCRLAWSGSKYAEGSNANSCTASIGLEF